MISDFGMPSNVVFQISTRREFDLTNRALKRTLIGVRSLVNDEISDTTELFST